MKTLLLLCLVTVQLLLPAPGCSSISVSWHDVERDSPGGADPRDYADLTSAELCAEFRCRRLKADAARRSCALKCLALDDPPPPLEVRSSEQEAEAEGTEEDAASCLAARCAGRRGTALTGCAEARCGLRPRRRRLRTRPRPLPVRSPAAAKRMRGMWPDEFETRLAERAMWPDEYETRNVRAAKEEAKVETEAEVKAGGGGSRTQQREARMRHDDNDDDDDDDDDDDRGHTKMRTLVRHARSEEADPLPVGADASGNIRFVQKRWSTRLCMESHCKNAHSKVQYFMCGKAYCHR